MSASKGKDVKKTKNKHENNLLKPTAGNCATESASVECDLMEEFDQFVQYQSLRKETEELIESQEDEKAFNLFGGIDDEPEEGARNIMSINLGMSTNNEQTELGTTDRNNYNATQSSSAIVLILSKQDSVGKNMCIEPLTTTEEVQNICNEVLSLAQNSEYDNEANFDSEDSEEDTVACAGNEEYVFPTPEEADDASTPEVGKVFSTLDNAFRFANIYAQLNGFALIKGRNYKNRKLYFQCNRSRKRTSANNGLRKRKRNVIEGTNCPMNITVKLVDDKWHIASICLEHNHDLVRSPSLAKKFLSHRNMNEAEICCQGCFRSTK